MLVSSSEQLTLVCRRAQALSQSRYRFVCWGFWAKHWGNWNIRAGQEFHKRKKFVIRECQVLDENDNSPKFVQSQPNVTVPEDAKVGEDFKKPNSQIDLWGLCLKKVNPLWRISFVSVKWHSALKMLFYSVKKCFVVVVVRLFHYSLMWPRWEPWLPL